MMREDDYRRSLPRKRMAAGALFVDGAGGGLLVGPVGRDTWDLPGGVAARARGGWGGKGAGAGGLGEGGAGGGGGWRGPGSPAAGGAFPAAVASPAIGRRHLEAGHRGPT